MLALFIDLAVTIPVDDFIIQEYKAAEVLLTTDISLLSIIGLLGKQVLTSSITSTGNTVTDFVVKFV
ncbi:hypothetical protein [Moritella sp.]|uniref:hypothetical protein n=1 Tax=Moritella sp. TaxID=78556 RepID=UPI001D47D8A4|nr:hypothetical protein [Moritella sp.]MCJ8350038.1 hypothetical protein [Moritella sp.]NQZ39669.1 hypothetical protein [Moritella sp.]